MLNCNKNYDVEEFYKSKRGKFHGFLPVLDIDCLSYYSCRNIGKDKSTERLVPVFGEINNDITTDLEYWYLKEISKKAKEEDKLQHEYYRDEYIENFNKKKYCVFFVGCDDGDIFMRFKSEEEFLKFMSTVNFFDEIYNHKDSMYW